ncbi:MAG: response regulator, partial [Pyrinomonadaceae bacterium]
MRLEFESNVADFPMIETKNFEDLGFSAPPSFDALLKKGIAAAQSGDRDLARKLLSQTTAMDPTSQDAWLWLASISDYPEELLAFLDRVLDINPANVRAVEWRSATNSLLAKTFAQRAAAADRDGSAELVFQCLEQAFKYDPECESAWVLKAEMADSDDKRLEFFNRVLSINPDNSEAVDAIAEINRTASLATLEKAKAAAAAGDRGKATEFLEDFLHDVPESVEGWVLKSHLAERLDDKLKALDMAAELDPDNETVRSGRAFIALTFGTKEERSIPVDSHRDGSSDGDLETLELAPAPAPIEFESMDDDPIPSEISAHDFEAEEHNVDGPSNAATGDPAAILMDEVFHLTPTDPTDIDWDAELSEIGNVTLFTSGSVAPIEVPNESSTATVPLEVSKSHTEAVEELNEALLFEATDLESPDSDDLDIAAESVAFTTSAELSTDSEKLAAVNSTFEDLAPLVPVESDLFAPANEVDSLANSDTTDLFENADDMSGEVEMDDSDLELTMFGAPEPELTNDGQPAEMACPFCHSANDKNTFECASCNAVLTFADLELLLSNTRADREAVQNAVTQMEAEWNLREFTEHELTALSIGHFNLHNYDAAFNYLQEAARLDANNVILGGHVNKLAIRLDEMRRQTEVHDAMPKGKTILVVDDSPTVRKLISGKLEKSGHNVVCAVDGVDALEKIKNGMPDLVLLDIAMPKMDGYEVCKEIRANPAGKELPVVM